MPLARYLSYLPGLANRSNGASSRVWPVPAGTPLASPTWKQVRRKVDRVAQRDGPAQLPRDGNVQSGVLLCRAFLPFGGGRGPKPWYRRVGAARQGTGGSPGTARD